MHRFAMIVLFAALIAIGLAAPLTAKTSKKDRRSAPADHPSGRDRTASAAPTTAPGSRPASQPTRAEHPRSQSDEAADAMRKQQSISRALRDRTMRDSDAGASGKGSEPGRRDQRPSHDPAGPGQPSAATAAKVADLQRQLDMENTRHDAALSDLNHQESAAAGDRSRTKRVHKMITSENDAHAQTVASLQQQMRDLRSAR